MIQSIKSSNIKQASDEDTVAGQTTTFYTKCVKLDGSKLGG
jgi:hypothetical protein